MQTYVDQLENKLNLSHLQNYWKDFKGTAYALFDEKEVFLFNHPKCQGAPYIKLSRTEQFNGCTLILFEEVPTAIVDSSFYQNFDELYSIFVHELFHGFQYLYGENRFADESVGFKYPIDDKNIAYRIQERQKLFEAYMANDETEMQNCINEFISLREARCKYIAEYVQYENFIETIEGPAHYVEFKALIDIQKDTQYAFNKFTSMLLNEEDSHINIRKGCYSSGLFLCLLLDKYCVDWQSDFTNSPLSLFDFIKTKFNHQIVPVKVEQSKEKIHAIMDQIVIRKKYIFKQFHNTEGIKIVMKGAMKVAGFDPMNITLLNNQALHQRFINIKIGETNFILEKEVLTTFENHIMTINNIEFYVDTPPIQIDNMIEIKDIGPIKGSMHLNNNVYYISL